MAVCLLMHLLLGTSAAGFRAAAIRFAKDKGIWTWPGPAGTVDPQTQRVELVVGDQTLRLPPEQVASIVTELAAG